MLQRSLTLPVAPRDSFFLWGARQVGKSSLLQERYDGIEILPAMQFLRALWADEIA